MRIETAHAIVLPFHAPLLLYILTMQLCLFDILLLPLYPDQENENPDIRVKCIQDDGPSQIFNQNLISSGCMICNAFLLFICG